ncbi:MAG: hypothetical protein AAGD13_14425 [Pseudomonadota bacterium]
MRSLKRRIKRLAKAHNYEASYTIIAAVLDGMNGETAKRLLELNEAIDIFPFTQPSEELDHPEIVDCFDSSFQDAMDHIARHGKRVGDPP